MRQAFVGESSGEYEGISPLRPALPDAIFRSNISVLNPISDTSMSK
jgi:hypothetical protein